LIPSYKFGSCGCRFVIAAVVLGVGVDLQFQEPVAVEEVCRDRGKGVVLARQRGEVVVDAFVVFTKLESN